MENGYPAHIFIDSHGKETYQSVEEHCRKTAEYARESLSCIGLGETAYIAGLLHDMGKMKKEFAEYIICASHDEKVSKGSVNHTFAGVRFLLDYFHKKESNDEEVTEELTVEMIAYTIGAHHGLFDAISGGKNGYSYRREKKGIGYDEAKKSFLSSCTSESEIKVLLDKAINETKLIRGQIDECLAYDSGEQLFLYGLVTRLLLSAVINGDRRDTAEFMRQKTEDDNSVDSFYWEKRLAYMEEKLAGFSSDSPINHARKTISDKCAEIAYSSEKSGVFRLNVPTGAGKTLSALRFALAVAKKHNKCRIVFTAPLISILDQNAEIIRDYCGDDKAVLIHHSNLIRDMDDGSSEEKVKRELLMENWNSPIIITTLVQLLNTMYCGKTSSIRRLQALCNSVIIIDEVQTVPIRLLSLFNMAVRFLVDICNCTCVLCSATQPCLEVIEHPITTENMHRIEDIVPYDEKLWRPFNRTRLIDDGHMTMDNIPEYIMKQMEKHNSLLMVCNSRKEAADIFSSISDKGIMCYHLSASMCMAHRRIVLEKIIKALEEKNKIICISTSVIEAGVDISFDCVIRVITGLDSIIQSAGRCNRNGEQNEQAPVYIIRIDNEKLGSMQEIKDAQAAMIELIEDYHQTPDVYLNSLMSDKAVESYYRRLYHLKPDKCMDGVYDKGTLYDLLSYNVSEEDNVEREYILNQAFKKAGSIFSVFDSDTMDLLVPYGDGKKVISDLLSEKIMYDPLWLRSCIEHAKPFTVSIYDHQRRKLEEYGALIPINDGMIYVLSDGFYNSETGITLQKEQTMYLEV